MSTVFEPGVINGMELSNRFVRSATWEGMATEDGAVTPRLIDAMVALAEGGVGLIITSHAYILPEGQAGPWQLGIYKDELVNGLKELTKAVHDYNGKIVIQIAHSGHFASKALIGRAPLAVSNIEGLAKSPREEMSIQYIQALPAAFADAAERAKAAGFDGVEIHSAHGYLLSQFLSPAFNKRQDEYGGDIGNRAKIHLAVLNAIRERVGREFPVLIKMNCRDFDENGLNLEDSLQAGRWMVEAGLNAIELSGGLITGGKLSPSRFGIKSAEQEAYFKEEALAFKKEVDVPLILVGGMRSLEVAERLIEEGVADYISMSRPLIREPDLINRWKSGDRRRALCKSDNLCFGPGREGKGVYCVTKEREKGD